MAINKKKYGKYGEELARGYLINNGFEIIERNYTFGRGEIDIIAKEKECLVFVEVKYRKSYKFGQPEYSISKRKLEQIKKIASAYLYEKEIRDTDCRIDVVTIVNLPNKKPVINHIRNAMLF